MLLAEVVRHVSFPLFALPDTHWQGIAFLGDVRSIGTEVREVQLMYTTRQADAGFVVSHLAPEAAEDPRDPLRLTDHLSSFVSHFQPKLLASKARRGRYVVFAKQELRYEDRVMSLAGHPAAAKVVSHPVLPLIAARTAIVQNGQAVDLCVAGWQRDPLQVIPAIRSLTPADVRAFDAGKSVEALED